MPSHCTNQVNILQLQGMLTEYNFTILNEIIKFSLIGSGSTDPTGLCSLASKRPNEVKVIPCKSGCTLVWYATCIYTFAVSHLAQATREAGTSAAFAKKMKKSEVL